MRDIFDNQADVMQHIGEIISLGVAVSWTITAWFADKASRRVGAMVTNVLRLALATLFLGILLWITLGITACSIVICTSARGSGS